MAKVSTPEDDTLRIVAGMRHRMDQLSRVADMAFNPEVRAAVLKVTKEIEAEVQRLEAEAPSNVVELKFPSSIQA